MLCHLWALVSVAGDHEIAQRGGLT